MRAGLLVVALGVVATVARLIAHLQTDWLWYHELGQERVFWTMLAAKWLGAMLVALATTLFLLTNFWVVERAAPDVRREHAPSRRLRRMIVSAYIAVSAGAGVIAGRTVLVGDWQQILLWTHRRNFGVTDPVFHRDVGFFVFSLPLYRQIAGWLLVTLAVALATVLVGYVANGAIRLTSPRRSATRGARVHLLVLGALLLLVTAWQHRLSQFALELPRPGVEVPGGYTDLHVQLPWMGGLVVVALFGAAVLLYSALRRSWALPATVVVLVAVAELVNPATLPSLVQRYLVDPQTLTRERPYIARQIRFTQLAYGLRGIGEQSLPANATISRQELRSNQNVLRNVQLWDTGVLRADIDEHQSIGSYYSFPNATVDRYRQGGRDRLMILLERQLDLQRLERSGRTWANDRLAYTHGYGLVAVPAGSVDPAGRPTLTNSEFGAGPAATRVRQPRLYYGVQPRGAQPWVITRTNRAEIERPVDGTAEPGYHYGGNGGIPLSGLVRRGLFALRFGDANFLISPTIKDRSRLVLHRDVRDRLRTLAPFLSWGDHPDAVIVGGRVQYLMYGYTASKWYPYSHRIDVGGTQLNYMRAAVVATVDAFSGRVAIFATGTDPILNAWRDVFPTLFTPASRMPADLRAHLRYPRELFDVQSQVWETYHASDVENFYTRVDAWQRPADLSGPVDRVGSIRFRPRSERPAQNQEDALRAPRTGASFMLARLPGDQRERFMLTTTFTPHGQENLSGYLGGYLDERGLPQLRQLTLPPSRLVLGPAQVTRQILATPAVGDQLRLLNQETTDLGARSVDAVQLGEPRVIPIGDSFLFAQSIYVTAAGHGVTRLRLVAVYLNGRVGYGRNLDEAMRRAQGTNAAPVKAAPAPSADAGAARRGSAGAAPRANAGGAGREAAPARSAPAAPGRASVSPTAPH